MASVQFVDKYYPGRRILLQSNARCHTSAYTKDWFFDIDVVALDWFAWSRSLHPIKNLRGLIALNIYSNGHQFDSLDELKNEPTMA